MPAIFTPARARWSSVTAARSRPSEDELRALPGIGDYTAAAIAAIAFDVPASPVDGNIERVVARLFAVEDPMPGAKLGCGSLRDRSRRNDAPAISRKR